MTSSPSLPGPGRPPKPISRVRLERLVKGLRLRAHSSAQNLSRQVDQIRREVRTAESQHQFELQQWEEGRQQQQATTITQWDEHRMRCWDQAEQTSYRAVFETQAKEKTLRDKAKQELDHVQKESTKRISDIESRYTKAVDASNKRLSALQERFAAFSRAALGLEQSAEAALAKHSLSIPASVKSIEPENVKDSTQAVTLAEASLRAGQHHLQRLEHLPLVQFFSSAIWWTICAAVFLTSTGLVNSTTQLGWALSAAVAAAITGLVVLITLLGVRPWLKRSAAAEYPRFQGQVQLAAHYRDRGLAIARTDHQNELQDLAAKREQRMTEVHQWKDTQVEEIKHKVHLAVTSLRAKAREEKVQAALALDQGLRQVDDQFTSRSEQESKMAAHEKWTVEQRLENQRTELENRIQQIESSGWKRLQNATRKALDFVGDNRRWCQSAFPAWEDVLQLPDGWPEPIAEPMLALGQVQLLADEGKVAIDPSLSSGVDSENSATLLFSALQDEYLVVHADPNLPQVKKLIRNLVLRALTVLPCGKTQVCVIDPPGLGRDFGWLMALGDFDPTLVSHRVWTQSSHIAKQLQNLASGAEDFIQQSLRNQYRHIVEYNRDAGGLAEPFRLLVWNSLPNGLDELSWKSLQSILDTGARCGIIPILVVDPALNWTGPQQEILQRRGLHLHWGESGHFTVASQHLPNWKLLLEPAPSEPQSDSIIQAVGSRALAASRVEVPLASMLDFLPSPSEIATVGKNEDNSSILGRSWQANSSRFLEIPIGQSGVGRVHSMKLGVGTAQHAIIAGKTGSGKSSLLHALITSSLLKYSPKNLRLVLLDFKKGVEFQVYCDAAIPHADIIGIESHREFGLSALQYVDDCLQRRGELFRSGGAQDIASWNATHPEQTLPRVLLVIDEFQELFVEDDKLSQAASLILDRIVRQGRSFGVHAVLSSQTLAGSYSLPRTTLGQMAVRIALQCDASDAQIIFSDDNPAAARLKHPGQAVYNDAGGRIEGNQPMQIGWLDKSTQIRWFAELPKGYDNQDATTNRLGRTVIYDGNRPATWDSDNADLGIHHACTSINPDALWCAAGESVAINPAVVFPLTNQSGRNMLIVGGDDAMAASVMTTVAHCFVKASLAKNQTPQIVAIQGAKPTDSHSLALPSRWKELPCPTLMEDAREAGAVIEKVHAWLQERMADQQKVASPVLLNLIQLSRLRSLRREDEFSFSQPESSPDKQLEELLRDGPSHGIHVLIWAESYSTVNRWLPRTALREMEIRLLMQMSTGDSANLVDTVAAAHLGDHVMLLYDEATGQEQKFRPYAWESLIALPQWIVAPQSTLSPSAIFPSGAYQSSERA